MPLLACVLAAAALSAQAADKASASASLVLTGAARAHSTKEST